MARRAKTHQRITGQALQKEGRRKGMMGDNKASEVEKWKSEKYKYAMGYRILSIPDRMGNHEISTWKGCCHWCNRVIFVAGEIGNDGLCEFCRRNGRRATW